MTAYEFYMIDKNKGKTLIGILPERRTVQERINDESIMNWAKLAFGNTLGTKNVFYERIIVCQDEVENYYPRET